jgi:hypothetical protein
MTTTKVNVDFVTEYKGSNNLKRAQKDILGLGSAFKSLAGGFAIEQLIQRSFAAFKAENTAVVTLTNSLNNMGISYSSLQPVIEQQNSTFESLGFNTEQTLGAYTKLTTALGNPAKAMDVMGTAADLARYKNASLEDTAVKMSKAIAGNSRAFADLGLKIDKSLTPQNAFNKLMEQAKAKVGGLAVAYSKTAAGALDVLSAKTTDASAKLGEKLAPAIAKLAEFATNYLVPIFSFLADNISVVTALATALGVATLAMKGLGIASAVAAGEMALNPIFAGIALATLLAAGLATKSKGTVPTRFARLPTTKEVTASGASTSVDNKLTQTKKLTAAEKLLAALEKQWNDSSIKAANAQTKAAKDKLALERASLSLKLAGSTLDMQNIEIQAALQRGQNQSVTDVLLLQRAILNGNADQAEVLAQKVLKSNDLVMTVDGTISKLSTAKDPFKDWPSASQAAIDEIKAIEDEYAKLKSKTITVTVNSLYTGTANNSGGPSVSLGVGGDQGAGTKIELPSMPSLPSPSVTSTNPNTGADSNGNKPVYVTVQLGNQTVANAVTGVQVDQSASGIPSSFQRSGLGTPLYPW